MIQVTNLSLRIGKRALFEDVNIKFTEGNCYGLIGANGAGKSTFLRILSGELEATTGDIALNRGERLSFLRQDHFQFDKETVLDTILMGNPRLYAVTKEKERLYAKTDFTETDGIRAAELEAEYAELNGWESETSAAELMTGLGLEADQIYKSMSQLETSEKVKVLLAQALFGDPDVLLLDEPTNHLDLAAIAWLEEFLINFENTVIVVSHDRHFLNQVCTHIADIDFGRIALFTGNYDFWYESSQLLLRQMKDSNRKKEEKIKELQDFVARFSANASKSRQATSRKKALEKIELEDIRPSSRKYPYIDFKPNREIGNDVLWAEGLSIEDEGVLLLNNASFRVERGDKVVVLAEDEKAASKLFEVLMGSAEAAAGIFKWGTTTSQAHFPREYSDLFDSDNSIVDWLWQFTDSRDETYVRGFLGRMLFSGEEALKPVRVLSGGEKVRCLLSRMMLSGANILLMDDPTNHLDMESIQALNNALINFQGVMLFTSHDHQFIQTIANRVVTIDGAGKLHDYQMTYDEFLALHQDQMKSRVYNFPGEEE
ncbi:MAG: ATP-binding cassette domain-containing protein [Clostridia bacterium]|nr:ATP-binding cassette domain-containing protein [Clostridia bacterium]